ncbi:MAG: YqgE/AlgH family protein [Burkholderiales bacterium]|nr:YqgE/AlgH family protein [Burkholderiales bacterium]
MSQIYRCPGKPIVPHLFVAFLLLAFTVAASAPAAARDRDADIGSAILLAANPGLNDPVYARTVLLAAPGPNGWHFGLIVNRPTDRSLSSLFPEHVPSRKVKEAVHFGGPMATHALLALVKRKSSPGNDALRFSEELYLAVASTTVDSVIESTPGDARFYMGWVVWRPGELRAELRAGYWSVHNADTNLVFRSDTKTLWQELRQTSRGIRTGVDPAFRLTAR